MSAKVGVFVEEISLWGGGAHSEISLGYFEKSKKLFKNPLKDAPLIIKVKSVGSLQVFGASIYSASNGTY